MILIEILIVFLYLIRYLNLFYISSSLLISYIFTQIFPKLSEEHVAVNISQYYTTHTQPTSTIRTELAAGPSLPCYIRFNLVFALSLSLSNLLY